MIEIFINGEKKKVQKDIKLKELLNNLNIQKKRIAIEVNRKIIPKKEHSMYILQDKDKIEIVHPVGGG